MTCCIFVYLFIFDRWLSKWKFLKQILKTLLPNTKMTFVRILSSDFSFKRCVLQLVLILWHVSIYFLIFVILVYFFKAFMSKTVVDSEQICVIVIFPLKCSFFNSFVYSEYLNLQQIKFWTPYTFAQWQIRLKQQFKI